MSIIILSTIAISLVPLCASVFVAPRPRRSAFNLNR